MKKRQLYDKKTGKNFVPISHTKAVLTPTGETAEARNTRQQQAVQGTGVSASANRYPFMSLGDVTSIADVNRLLDTAYTSTDTKYQGRLRLRRSGQVAWVDQVLMNSLLGNWVQVLYGCYAPSSTGNSVVVDGKYHILWRQRTGTTSMPWRDLTSQMTLKTINGQSIAGSGNIQISDAKQITIDKELDADSENAIANKVVTESIEAIQTDLSSITHRGAGIIEIDYWQEETPESENYSKYWYKPSEGIFEKQDGTWIDVSGDLDGRIFHFSENTEDRVDDSFYWWDSADMNKIYGEELAALNRRVKHYVVDSLVSTYTSEQGTYTSGGTSYAFVLDKSVPRVVLKVWYPESVIKYFTNWAFQEDGKEYKNSDYTFTENDIYIWYQPEGYLAFGFYNGSSWRTSIDDSDFSGNIAEMYDVAYDEDDCDQDSNFPAGDDNHQYAIYNVLLYKWKPGTYEWEWPGTWEQVNRADPDIPFLIKCKNKIWKVWSDEKTVVFDFSPDDELDETSKNAVQNKVVAARINEHSERLDDIETALPSVRGCKVLPIDGVMPAGTTYIIEEVGYAGEGGELLLDVTNQRVVLALTEDGGEEIATLYFAVWNDASERYPNDVYDLTDPTNIIFAWEGEGALHFGKLSGETLVEIAAGSTPTINIDTALSRTSANPVQNAAIYNAVKTLTTSLNSQNTRITNIENSVTKTVWTIRVWGDEEQASEDWHKGDLWWNPDEAELKICVSGNEVAPQPSFEDTTPIEGVMYYAVETKKWYIWDGNEFDELLRASSQS